jgi:cation diffusion facilitator family transporter
MSSEKQKATIGSIIAAFFIAGVKIIASIFTGSLGMLSEAAESTLDLGVSFVTFFAVRFSDKPADEDHNYGHGKIESFSALITTVFLLVTCGWIITQAINKIISGKFTIEIAGAGWGIAVLILTIVVNISRAKRLNKVAKKFGSQALEADALHFTKDAWSTVVVIVGLIFAGIGDAANITILKYADPVAALGVSVLVIIVSIKLGKRTIDVLLDKAPRGMVEEISHEVNTIDGVLDVSNIRIRPSGASFFIDLSVGLNREESHRVVHSIVDEIRENIQKKIPNSDIVISTYPVDVTGMEKDEVYLLVKRVIDKYPTFTNIHNINIYEVSGKKYISIHIELRESMSLKQSHDLSHEISEKIQEEMKNVEDVNVKFERVLEKYITAEDITNKSESTIEFIKQMVNKVPNKLNCHDIKIYREGEGKTIFLHCELNGDYSIEKTEMISKNISNKIRRNIDGVDSVHIHVEPIETE